MSSLKEKGKKKPSLNLGFTHWVYSMARVHCLFKKKKINNDNTKSRLTLSTLFEMPRYLELAGIISNLIHACLEKCVI